MKKIKIILLFSIFAFLFAACESDIDKVVMSSNPTLPGLEDVVITTDFNVSNMDSLVNFSWSAAEFGFTSSVTYDVEAAPVEDFSEDVMTLLSTQETKGSVEISVINNALLTWKKEVGTETTLYYRVSASLSPSQIYYSQVKAASLTPFEVLREYPMMYVPGSYQGWTPGGENGRLYSYESDNIYQNIIRLVDGEQDTVMFKVTVNPNWDGPNYGGVLTQDGNNYSATLDASGGNFAAVKGTYQFEVDKSALTLSMTKTDDWGIIGSAIPPYDWSADVDMFYNGQRKMWEVTGNFKAGGFKFRANDDWVFSYGDNGGDGVLDSDNGADIPLAEDGNYTIRFNPVTLKYTVQKN
ncbi:MAG: hypothetical protein CR986_05940 [Ignavibacteriae bacterium]|nr:MAG: hypothetical protein CR986_05940 [Ignavibacteriota bacterium]